MCVSYNDWLAFQYYLNAIDTVEKLGLWVCVHRGNQAAAV